MQVKQVAEVVAAIHAAQQDNYLQNLMPFIAEDWLNWVLNLRVPEQTIALMQLVEKLHPTLSHSVFRVGGAAARINPAILAKWLFQRASSVGAEEAYLSICNIESNANVTAYNITLINGLHFEGVVDFGESIFFCDYHHLPDGIKENVSHKIMTSQPDVRPPYTFLCQPFRASLLSEDIDDFVMCSLQSYIRYESLIVNFLSLFSATGAPCIDRRWCLLQDVTPMSGIIDNNYTKYLEIRPPKGVEDWTNLSTSEVIELYAEYIQIPEKRRLPIDISLWRRSQAMNTWDSVNKAIDLGIALESVLTSPKTRDQLSLQIRVLGAKLASSYPEKRAEVFSKLKCIYGIRSEAVHNGAVEKSYKIKGMGDKSTSSILDEGISILGDCLKEIIKRGGLSQEDTEKLLID